MLLAGLGTAPLATLIGGRQAAAQEVTLRAITILPRTHSINKPFHDLLAAVNEQGKGTVRIQYLGGPEAMPIQEQMPALQRGVVDIFYGPAGYFDGIVPESGAQNASNLSAMELRANGAQALLNEAFNKRAGAQYLGYYGSGYSFNIFLRREPKRTPAGGVDLTGLKIRGAANYRPFFEKLGANTVQVQIPEMHSALERGVLDGIGFTNVGMTEVGWEKFLRYRILPNYWQGDIALLANLSKWRGLTPAARDLLTRVVTDNEKAAHAYFQGEIGRQDAFLKQAGMQDIVLEGAPAREYLEFAHGSLWEQLSKRVTPEELAALQKAFYRG